MILRSQVQFSTRTQVDSFFSLNAREVITAVAYLPSLSHGSTKGTVAMFIQDDSIVLTYSATPFHLAKADLWNLTRTILGIPNY